MKVLIKILLAILAVGGVCYWLLSKFAQPAKRLKEWHRARMEEKDEDVVESTEDVASSTEEN